MRKLVHGFISRAQLDISSLYISSPDASGLCAKGKIRLSHLGTGPIPLVGLRVKFKDPDNVVLYRAPAPGTDSSTSSDRIPLARVTIHPLTLQPGTPGSVSSEVDLKLLLDPSCHGNFVDFIKDIVRADPKTGTRVQLSATGVQVTAFGLKFGGLKLQKDVMLGGLGCLGGALNFGDLTTQPGGYSSGKAENPSHATIEARGKAEKKWTFRKGKQLAPNKATRTSLSSAPVADSSSSTAVEFKSPFPPTSRRLDISGLQIVGGDAKRGIEVRADVTIDNPAISPSLTIEPGELRFVLCVPEEAGAGSEDEARTEDGVIPPGFIKLGSLSLEPMVLRPGPNQVKAHGHILLPPPPDNPNDSSSRQYRAYKRGQQSIAKILQNEVLEACAIASKYDADNADSGASTVGWLAEAFEHTRIDARIPPLGERVKLLDGAELRVEGSDGTPRSPSIYQTSPSGANTDLQSSVARATLRNSFDVDLHIDEITVLACSSALYDDEGNLEILELGRVNGPRSQWRGMTLRKGGEPTHVSLPMEINPDPKVLIEILLKSARSRHVNLGNSLTSLLEELRASQWSEAGWSTPPKSRPSSSVGTSRGPSFDQTSNAPDPSEDLASLLSSALANLRVTAHIEASARIGNFAVPGKLKYRQKNLPIALSTTTAASLLPLVGKPFVKAMVDRADVEVTSIQVKRMDDRGLSAKVGLRLVNFGPLNATVRFISGLQLRDEVDGVEETLAVLECNDELPVFAGREVPTLVDARIAMPPGPKSRQLFSSFVGRLISCDSAQFIVFTDRLSATSGGVHFETSLRKPVVIDGLGGFPGMALDGFEVTGEASAPVDGVSISVAAPASVGHPTAVQFRARTTIKNKGDLSLNLQKVECSLAIDGVAIGQATLDGLNLKARGACPVEVMGLIYAPMREGKAREAALGALSKLIEQLLGGERLSIQVRGQRGWAPDHNNRPVSLAWLDEALRLFETSVSLQWKDGVQVIEEVNVGCIEAVFPARGSMQIKVQEVTASYCIPFPIHITIQSIEADLDIMFQNKVMGTCSAVQEQLEYVDEPASSPKRQRSSSQESNPISAKGATGKVRVSLKTFELTSAGDGMSDMISHAMQAGPDGTNAISLRGTARAVVLTALGKITIRVRMGHDHLVKIAGLDGLRTSPFQYTSLNVVAANPKYILATLDLYLNNPSDAIQVHIPDSSLTMAAYFADAYLGDVIIGGDGKGIMLNSGPIKINGVEFRYRPSPSSEPATRAMLTRFLSGTTSTLNIRGHAKSSTNADLALALSALDLPVEVKPIDQNILERISVQLGMSVVTSNSIDAIYIIRNPINLDIDILHLEVAAFYRSNPFGTASKSYSKESRTNRLLLPAGEQQIQNQIVIKLSTPLDKLVWAFLDERGSIVLDVQLKAVLDINGFVIPNFEYNQRVPLDVSGLQGVAKLLRLV